MTLLKPTLIVKRLIVYQNNHIAFDCPFHNGVNVIRGRNSSGKTTIMDLLAFSLGSENIRWKPEALLCTETLVEVELNGEIACFKREISEESQRPLSIFYGDSNKALTAPFTQWNTFPFKRSQNKISFSQAIFTMLDLPIAQGEGSSNITMHQILRVLYADQPSIHSPIFRIDAFDSSLTKETVGEYLCGIFNNELYDAQIRLREVDLLLTTKVDALKSIFNILGHAGKSDELVDIDTKLKNLEKERNELIDKLITLKTNRVPSNNEDKNLLEANSIREKLNNAKQSELRALSQKEKLNLDIADTSLFICELKDRLINITQSSETKNYFGNVQFNFCPSCFHETKAIKQDKNTCHLCKEILNEESSNSQLLRMKNEIALQVKESESLINKKEEELKTIELQLPSLNKEVKKLSQDYNLLASVWVSPLESEIESTSRLIGKLDSEINQAHENRKLLSIITNLKEERTQLENKKVTLQQIIENQEIKQEIIKKELARIISDIMVRLLKLDLPLQKEFISPHEITFDFSKSEVYVNGAKNFSESSAVILRHLFHLALLSSSMEKEYMRLPHFLMLDGIDDGGMEKERSHNLQEIIVNECLNYKFDYQVIFATSEINPKFENSALVVGDYFNPEKRSLNIKSLFNDKPSMK